MYFLAKINITKETRGYTEHEYRRQDVEQVEYRLVKADTANLARTAVKAEYTQAGSVRVEVEILPTIT